MRSRLLGFTRITIAAGLAAIAAPASAQVVQSLQFGGGLFLPAGAGGRTAGDVLVQDQTAFDFPMVFRISSFRSAQVSGEWTVAFGRHIEAGLGVGFQSRTVPSFYGTIDNRGFPITQDLRLRIVPVTAVVRFLPFGRPGRTQPFVGVGAAALRWQYREAGEFVDGDSNTFLASFTGSGWAPGAVLVYGVRLPVNGDIFGISLEGRYQWAVGKNLPQPDFLSNKIDLSGASVNFLLAVRF